MVIYLIMVSIILLLGIIVKPNKNNTRKKVYLIISFGIMTLVAVLRKYTIGIDLEILYVPKFIQIANRNRLGTNK